MYEYAKVIQDERIREADRYRIASSLPKCRSWELGNYKITIRRRSRDLVASGQ